MVHPAYSPDLALCDFWLFLTLKRDPRGWFFKSDKEVIQPKFHKTLEEKRVERLE